MMARGVRVAMVIQSYRPVLGGAQRQVEQLAPLLAARGVEVHVVTRRPAGTPALAQEPGATVHRTRGSDVGRGAGAAYVTGATAKLLRLRPDVLHAHDLLSPTSAALAAGAALHAPVVSKVLSAGEGGDVDRLLHKPLGARRLALTARRVAAFVCLSDQVEDELREHGVPDTRLERIANGVDTTHFHPASPDERRALRAELGVPTDGPLAVYCGRLHPVKRVPALAAASRAAGVRLVVVGEGPDEDELRGLAATGDGLVVLPTVRDIAPLLRAADLYASGSLTEGMSGSVLEAMACGLPVVAAPASGMPELLGETPGIAAGPDHDDLIAALSRAARDEAWRTAEGERLRATAVGRFGLDVTADRLVALYERVLRG